MRRPLPDERTLLNHIAKHVHLHNESSAYVVVRFSKVERGVLHGFLSLQVLPRSLSRACPCLPVRKIRVRAIFSWIRCSSNVFFFIIVIMIIIVMSVEYVVNPIAGRRSWKDAQVYESSRVAYPTSLNLPRRTRFLLLEDLYVMFPRRMYLPRNPSTEPIEVPHCTPSVSPHVDPHMHTPGTNGLFRR